jgi:hypothetical protein
MFFYWALVFQHIENTMFLFIALTYACFDYIVKEGDTCDVSTILEENLQGLGLAKGLDNFFSNCLQMLSLKVFIFNFMSLEEWQSSTRRLSQT